MEFQAQHTAQHLPSILPHRRLIARPPLHIPRHRLSTLQRHRLTAQLHQPTVPRRQLTVLLLLPTVRPLRHTVQRHQHTVLLPRSILRHLLRTALRRQPTARHHQTTHRPRLLTVLPHQRTVPLHLNTHRPHRHIAPLLRHIVQRLHSIVQQVRRIAPQAPHIHRLVQPTAQAQAKTETMINHVHESMATFLMARYCGTTKITSGTCIFVTLLMTSMENEPIAMCPRLLGELASCEIDSTAYSFIFFFEAPLNNYIEMNRTLLNSYYGRPHFMMTNICCWE